MPKWGITTCDRVVCHHQSSLDIAGVAWGVKSIDYHPSNSATGFGVRLLLDLLQQWRPLKK